MSFFCEGKIVKFFGRQLKEFENFFCHNIVEFHNDQFQIGSETFKHEFIIPELFSHLLIHNFYHR